VQFPGFLRTHFDSRVAHFTKSFQKESLPAKIDDISQHHSYRMFDLTTRRISEGPPSFQVASTSAL
jgi:hypothetical protein